MWGASAGRGIPVDNLLALLNSGDCSVVKLLQEYNVIRAISPNFSQLKDFFLEHFGDLMDLIASETNDTCRAARGVVVQMAKVHAHDVSESPEFHNAFNQALVQEKMDTGLAATLAVVVSNLVKEHDEQVLAHVADNRLLFPRFASIMRYEAVYDALIRLSKDWCHMEEIRTTDVLYGILQTKTVPAERVLGVMSCFVGAVESDSFVVADLATLDRTKTFIEYGLNGTPKESQSAWELLWELCAQAQADEDSMDDEDEEPSPLREAVYVPVQEKLADICGFVTTMTEFLPCHSRAIDLIVLLLEAAEDDIEHYVVDLAKFMFNRFFERKLNSTLHVACASLLRVLLSDASSYDAVVKELNMKARIVQEWGKQGQETAGYWGFLTHFTDAIVECGAPDDEDEDPEWVAYLEGEHAKKKKVLTTAYGGPVQKDSGGWDNLEGVIGRKPAKVEEKPDEIIDDEFDNTHETIDISGLYLSNDDLDDDLDEGLSEVIPLGNILPLNENYDDKENV